MLQSCLVSQSPLVTPSFGKDPPITWGVVKFSQQCSLARACLPEHSEKDLI